MDQTHFWTAWFIAVLAIGAPLNAPLASGQSSPSDPLVIPKIEDPIELDGRPNEPAWKDARALSPVQHRPNFGEVPTEKTEFLIGYTEEYLWVARRCYD